jgi:protein TonB
MTIAHTVPPPGRGKRRVGAFVFALMIQAGLVAVLLFGLRIAPGIEHKTGIDVFFPKTDTGTKPPPAPPTDPNVKPPDVYVPAPDFPPMSDDGGGTRITTGPTTPPNAFGPTDHGPLSVAATHTVPPYPPIYARLGSQGTVVLRLTISPQGYVTDAVVLRSTGIPGLDDVARAWVIAHWRYQPAIRGGAAVPSTANVAVEFNLRNAG